MKKIKIAEAKAIVKSNPNLDPDCFMYGVEWLNKGGNIMDAMGEQERKAVALYMISRDVDSKNGLVSNARMVCRTIEIKLGLPYNYCLSLVRDETTKQGRILIAELNMGLDHITLTNNNPYFPNKVMCAI